MSRSRGTRSIAPRLQGWVAGWLFTALVLLGAAPASAAPSGDLALTISPATRQSPPFAGIVLYDFVLTNNGPGTVANGHEWAHLTATSPAGASAASSLFAASVCTLQEDGSVNCFWPLPSGGLPRGTSASFQLPIRGLV